MSDRTDLIDFRPLDSELAHWDRAPVFWWRDDDAIEPSPALDRLIEIAETAQAPLSVAAVPNHASPSLGRRLAEAGALALVHGWAHADHAAPSAKKCEFPDTRPLAARLADAAEGLRRLTETLGPAARPVFTPPWNRIGADLVPELPGLGYRGLSTARRRRQPGPSQPREVASGLVQVDIELDPVAWRRGKSMRPAAEIVSETVDALRSRRDAVGRAEDPIGFLTHHLIHDAASWGVIAAFASGLSARGVVWRDADALFGARTKTFGARAKT